MSDKTELTREEVERLCSTVGGSPLAVEVLPGTWRWYKWPPPPEWEQALAMAPVAYRQLLAAMDELAEARATLAATERRVLLAAADAVVAMAHKERALFGSGHNVDHSISVLVGAAEALREMADEVTDAD